MRKLGILLCSLFSAMLLFSQNSTVNRDSQAMVLVANALQALTHGQSVQGIYLRANTEYNSGPDAIYGTSTLEAQGSFQSRVTLDLNDSIRETIHDQETDPPSGSWFGTNDKSHAIALHNCRAEAVWFFPALSVLQELSNPYLGVSYLGEVTHAGVTAYKLRFYFMPTSKIDDDNIALTEQLTQINVYIDPNTSLPSAISYQLHPDNNAMAHLRVEVRFSHYQNNNGIEVPMQITRYLQGTQQLSMHITDVVLNPTFSASEFSPVAP